MANYGIEIDNLKDSDFFHLISLGSSPAFFCYKYRLDRMKNSNPARYMNQKRLIEAYKDELESKGLKFNFIMEHETAANVVQLLVNIPIEVQKMPMRALMNSLNNYALNKKLSTFHASATIGRKRYDIKNNRLTSDSETFTPADIKKIKFSLMWLNYFISSEAKRNHDRLRPTRAVSNANIKIFRDDGFDGLLNVAKKGTKRILKKGFSKLPDDRIYIQAFFKTISIQLTQLLNSNQLTERDIKTLRKSYSALQASERRPDNFENYPISYLFNPVFINERFKGFEKLNSIGIHRIKDLKFLHPDIFHISKDFEFINALSKSFSK